MRAAWYEREGAPEDVLVVGDLDQPAPGPGEVLVEIVVSGINPTDVKTRSGVTSRPIDGFRVPHVDGSGTIAAVGDGVDPARVGERVWLVLASVANRYGTAAEFCVVPAEQAIPLPDEASWELGACLGVPALTAVEMLRTQGDLRGALVLVQGGTGAVGHYAVQAARWMGATVIATAGSTEKCAQAIALGAHHAYDYRSPSLVDDIRAVGAIDVVTEVSLVDNWETDLAVLGHGGTVITYATDARPLTMPIRPAMNIHARLQFFLLYSDPSATRFEGAAVVNEAVRAGALTTLPIHRYSLGDIVEAHQRVEALMPGKTVIDLRQS